MVGFVFVVGNWIKFVVVMGGNMGWVYVMVDQILVNGFGVFLGKLFVVFCGVYVVGMIGYFYMEIGL